MDELPLPRFPVDLKETMVFFPNLNPKRKTLNLERKIERKFPLYQTFNTLLSARVGDGKT